MLRLLGAQAKEKRDGQDWTQKDRTDGMGRHSKEPLEDGQGRPRGVGWGARATVL